MRILCIGPLWRGSNAGGLFKAFSRKSCIIDIIDEFYYISLRSQSLLSKTANKLNRKLQLDDFNKAILKRAANFNPDILFVYKGAFVLPDTLKFIKTKGIKPVLFFPDVSLGNHGNNIPESINLYNAIFTTKTFGINDLKSKFNFDNAYFIPHGFDPEIHRKLSIDEKERLKYTCDVSFIGTWSAKKEDWLTKLVRSCPEICLKIWGEQWQRANSKNLAGCIQNAEVLGDLYSIAIQCSKINLGILSEKVKGSLFGDLITSRTFHIPAASGFMLHERNEESVLYFKEDIEAAFFDDADEMILKIKYYLEHSEERIKIQNAGHQRSLEEHSLDMRAEKVLNIIATL